MTVMPGRRSSGCDSTARFNSSRMARACARPSINRAGTGLSLAAGFRRLDRPRDFNREGTQVRDRRPLGDADGDLKHPWLIEDGVGDPFGDGLEQVDRLTLQDFAGQARDDRITQRVFQVVSLRRLARIQNNLDIGGEGLTKLPFGWIMSLEAVGLQAGQDQLAGWATGLRGFRGGSRPFCRHVLTNIPVR